ncbi:hypothetical protein [Okeania sp. SIO2B3]|uniref:hypothetical protein n=1 Tax=Okeania sp. SIO2B3 TaxID=2607784 RepID=UPI0013C1546B|nr:hypothetical protein [Okeania sp. SIO2B3]NET43382.1 hypothetical protein [Okeania sp. SIO2B3]
MELVLASFSFIAEEGRRKKKEERRKKEKSCFVWVLRGCLRIPIRYIARPRASPI